MTRCYRLLVAVLWQCLALVLAATPAQAAPSHIAAELVPESSAAPGQTVLIAIHMRPEAGWHGYWRNPGDAGLGMTLDWKLPAGAKAGEPTYPVPETLLISGLMNHVYVGDYAVVVPLTLPANARVGDRLPVSLAAQWLACTEAICVPERANLQTTVVVGTAGKLDPRFDRWRARLPAPLGSPSRLALDGKALRLAIPLPRTVELQDPHFFAAEDRAVAYAAPQSFSRRDDLLIVELKRPETAPADVTALSGVLRLNTAGDGVAISAAPGAVPPAGDPIGKQAEALPSLPLLLLAALAGGLLLNIMPCVFPILSLKALSLARAGESEAHARAEGLAYTAGVVVACVALGGLLLALRAGGQEVGWAFQLQEPGVVAALLLITAAITANLLGMFEFAVPGFATSGSPQGAFATGLLAAFVATPCTGPFMAAAMGAALLLPVPAAIALFVALGIGIALPFLAIAFIPPLRRRMPRPGAWMNTFRRWLALPMGLTALALLWLASRLGGTGFAIAAAVLAVLLIGALAIAGRRQRAGLSAGAPAWGGLALVAVLGFALLPRMIADPSARAEGLLAAKPYNAQTLAAARASGKPVFAYFTADWCLSCKVNEQVAIERDDTRDAFKKAGVTVVRGDWTRRDPTITRFLTEHGAAGVPLYLWYPAGGGEPRVLPQVLTQSMLGDLAAGGSAT